MISTEEIATLRDFASHDHHPVVSLYLNVNGASFPTRADYETEYSILASNIRRTAREELDFSKDQEGWLDEELSAIGEYLTLQFQRDGTRGLVIFSCKAEGLWKVSPLNVPVENHLYIDWKPQVAPLMETLSAFERICVLLVSKEKAHLFQMYAEEISGHMDIVDAVPKHHEQGGWEQNKLQRWHDKEVRLHLQKAAAVTMEMFKENRFDRLAVGVSDDLWPELEKVLHPYLKERLLGRFALDLTDPMDQIIPKVQELEEERRRQEKNTLLESLGPELDAGVSYVGGLDDVLAMLNQRRVDLLLVEQGYQERGRKCHSCNTLEFSEQSCPNCGRAAEVISDVVDEAREMTIRQGGRVMTVEAGHPGMSQAGGIAAHLRY